MRFVSLNSLLSTWCATCLAACLFLPGMAHATKIADDELKLQAALRRAHPEIPEGDLKDGKSVGQWLWDRGRHEQGLAALTKEVALDIPRSQLLL